MTRSGTGRGGDVTGPRISLFAQRAVAVAPREEGSVRDRRCAYRAHHTRAIAGGRQYLALAIAMRDIRFSRCGTVSPLSRRRFSFR